MCYVTNILGVNHVLLFLKESGQVIKLVLIISQPVIMVCMSS